MATDVIMPALEMNQETGTLISWLKGEGDLVHKGEPLMEVETDKITVEIEAPADGILTGIRAQPGEKIPVGATMASLVEPGEVPETTTVLDAVEVRSVAATPVAKKLADEHGLDLTQLDTSGKRLKESDVLTYLAEHRVPTRLSPASPLARRLAQERGVEISSLTGSGPEGAVLAVDIQAAPAVEPVASTEVVVVPSPAYTSVPIAGVREVVARRLQASYRTAPHIALTISADMSEVKRLFDRVTELVESETGQSLKMTAVVARVLATVLVKHRRVNAHVVDDAIREYASVHLGVAVALEDGLIVPVIREAQTKGLAAIQMELSDLTYRARSGGLSPSEVKGSTFTLSNLGMYGIEHFTAILNPPEAGILSVGTIRDMPVGVDGQIVLRPMMQMTLSVDHRAVDGAVAARFLKSLKNALENPYSLLV